MKKTHAFPASSRETTTPSLATSTALSLPFHRCRTRLVELELGEPILGWWGQQFYYD